MCQHLDSLNARLSQDLVLVVWSVVVSWSLSGHPTALPCSGTGVRWLSLPGPTGATESKVNSVANRQPLCVTSCVLCTRVRGRVSRSCATENTKKPARLEALFKLSVVTILRHLYRSHQNFCGLWVLFPIRHLVRHVLHLVRVLLVVSGVAIRLVHANASLFSFSVD